MGLMVSIECHTTLAHFDGALSNLKSAAQWLIVLKIIWEIQLIK